jgi:hypothetical protein
MTDFTVYDPKSDKIHDKIVKSINDNIEKIRFINGVEVFELIDGETQYFFSYYSNPIIYCRVKVLNEDLFNMNLWTRTVEVGYEFLIIPVILSILRKNGDN